MKLLLVSEYFPPKIMGGGEINVFLIAQALAKRGMEVTVLTSYHYGLERYESKDGIKIIRRLKTGKTASGLIDNFKRSFFSVDKEVKRLYAKVNFDGIHLFGTAIISAKKLSKLNVPIFATIESYPTLCPKGDRMYLGKRECKHICSFSKFAFCQQKSSEIGKMKNKWYLKYNPLFLFYVYWHYKKLNNSLQYCKLIAISKYVSNILLQHTKESTIVPNFIEEDKFDFKPIKNKKPKLIYLGSLTRFKGPHILLKAIEGLNCRCDIYGEGILKPRLMEMIKEMNLDAEIHAPVPFDKVPLIYASADLVIFPSIWPEPFGRIAIEAKAAGKPVIASNIGGIKETADILVEPGNISELRSAIEKFLLSRKKEKINLGEYTEEKVISKLIEVYQKC